MLARYPDTTVILAHALWHDWRELVYVSAQRQASRRGGGHALEHVYADISGLMPFYADSPNRDEIVWQLRTFGIDHVLFGSDYPLFTPEETLRAMDRYPFTDAERETILVRNAASVFGAAR